MKSVFIGYFILSLLGIAVLGSFGVSSCNEGAGAFCCITEIFARAVCPYENIAGVINFHLNILKTFSFGIFHAPFAVFLSFVAAFSFIVIFSSFADAKFTPVLFLRYLNKPFEGIAYQRAEKLRWLVIRKHCGPDYF